MLLEDVMRKDVKSAVFAGEFTMQISRGRDNKLTITILEINSESGGFQTRSYPEKNIHVLRKIKSSLGNNSKVRVVIPREVQKEFVRG